MIQEEKSMLSSEEMEKMGKAIKEIGATKTCITGPITQETKRLVMEKGLDAYVYDPLLSEQDVQEKSLRYIEPQKADLLFDPFSLKFEYPKKELTKIN